MTQDRPTITQAFADKSVFLTGATGFVGKAIIEKLLRSAPQIRQIYVLIRPRPDQSAADRLGSDILSSPLFDRLRYELADADAFFASKITAVAGDVTAPMLGLSASDQQLVQQNVQITIHSAASVKFHEPLDVAVNVNCGGALRVLDFVHACPLVESHVHISTAFTGTNQRDVGGSTTVREQLHPLGFDVEEAFDAISACGSSDEVEALQAKLIGTYANTYALTKSMTEHLLANRARKTLPLVILRPTVIGATWQEPTPGFIDQIAGVPGLFFAMGMGIVSQMVGDETKIVDLVPLDLFVNTALASTALALTSGPSELPWPFIVHSGTSDPRENPVSYQRSTRAALEFFQASPPQKGIFKPKMRVYKSPTRFQAAWFFRYQLPSSTLSLAATISRSRRLKKKATNFKKLTDRAAKIVDAFRPFTNHQWIFQADSMALLRERFGSDNEDWWLNASDLDWNIWTSQLCMGLKKYVLKEEGIEINPQNAAVVSSAA